MAIDKTILILATLGLCLSGCATIVEGTDQKITFDVIPATTTCAATRKGESIGTVSGNMPVLELGKSRFLLNINCMSPGFADTLRRITLGFLMLMLLFSSVCFGQIKSGAITGTVVDATGAVIPGASISAVNQETNVAANAVTDSSVWKS